MIKRLLRKIKRKLNPALNPCECGRHYCCTRHNYEVYGDGVIRLKVDKALQCPKFRAALQRFYDADLSKGNIH